MRLVTTEATRVGGGGREGGRRAAAAATAVGAGRAPVPVAKHEVSAGGCNFVPGRVDGEGDDFFFALMGEGGREGVSEWMVEEGLAVFFFSDGLICTETYSI